MMCWTKTEVCGSTCAVISDVNEKHNRLRCFCCFEREFFFSADFDGFVEEEGSALVREEAEEGEETDDTLGARLSSNLRSFSLVRSAPGLIAIARPICWIRRFRSSGIAAPAFEVRA